MKPILNTLALAAILLAFQPFCKAGDAVPAYLQPVADHLSRSDVRMMPVEGNDLEVITDGSRQWELMLHDINNARKSIYMEYYRWTNDEAGQQIHDAVLRKIREGLEVKVLLEDLCNPFSPKSYYEELKAAGAQVAFYTDFERQLWEVLPGINNRNHRKIIVIDDCLGYIGGRNIGIHYRDTWRDTHMRFSGPAVAQLRKLFMDMWVYRHAPQQNNVTNNTVEWKEVVTPASDPEEPFPFRNKTMQIATSGEGDTLLEKSVCLILRLAKEFVYIQTPYFCPTDTLLHSLQAAAQRGVDVRVCLPKESDSGLMTLANQAYYEDCLSHKVRIFEYEPRFNHSKVVLCDGCFSMIGSMNMDPRSLCINYEDMAAIYDTEVGEACRLEYLSLLDQSHEVSLEEVQAWPRKEKSARIFWRYHSGQL